MKGYLFNAEDKGGEYKTKLNMDNYAHNAWTASQDYDKNDLSGYWTPSGDKYGYGLSYSSNQNTPVNNMPPYLAVYMWKRTA